MWVDGLPPDSNWITEQQRPQWRADIAALRGLRIAAEQHPLRQGDLYNELKERWGLQMPALAREAGVPYHAARQRAHVAERIPPDSPLRATGLPYSILRLLAPLADPEPWVQQALALQEANQLRVRPFARLLEDGGVRRRRPRGQHVPTCLHCGRAVPDDTEGFYLRSSDTRGWLCSPACGLAHFSAGQPLPAPTAPASTATRPESQSPPPPSAPATRVSPSSPSIAAETRPESQSPSPGAAETRPESQSSPPGSAEPDSNTQTIKLRGRFVGQWKRRPRPW